jgi:hypothetical protein
MLEAPPFEIVDVLMRLLRSHLHRHHEVSHFDATERSDDRRTHDSIELNLNLSFRQCQPVEDIRCGDDQIETVQHR